ncbi:hypothetical protein H5410_022001 [Solanum commersonii]|uniref:Uncharacterized protein n=1 Tax=Solanum commersonii TaxID=4109 RepID=A0A9J5ZFW0_SOLCO|nr:hypothetical protein H5410_022001 [Solanum commersonii]
MGKGYGTRLHPLRLNLMSTHSLRHQSSEKTHFHLGEEELLSSSLHKTLSKLERKISAKVCSKVKTLIIIVFTNCAADDCSATLVEISDELGDPPFGQLITFSVLPLASSHSGSLGGTVLLRETDRRLTGSSFPRLLIPFLQGFAYWNEGRIPFLVLFNPICSILCLSVHASTKTSNT